MSRVSSVDDAARDDGGDEDAVAAGTFVESEAEDAARESTALEKFAESDDEDAALKEAIAAHEEDTLARFAESDAGDDEPLRSLPSRKPSRLEGLFDDDARDDEPLRSLPSREPSRLEGLFDDDRAAPRESVRRRRAPSDDEALVAQRTGTALGAVRSLIAVFTGGDDDAEPGCIQ